MRELERNFDRNPPLIAIVGRGRVGTALAAALREAGYEVGGPLGRGEAPPADAGAVLLCVPDKEIAGIGVDAPFVGHTSGATPVATLGHPNAFGLHPLQTITGPGTRLAGCGCAVAGTTPEAEAVARRLATDLGMSPFRVEDPQRAAYHAAASISSNFLVTLQAEAEQLASTAGMDDFDARRMLGPLVRTTVENWIELGPERALTGPVARGDHATVARQRGAVAAARPQLLPAFDALVERTEALAA